jgi:alkaline phosphatase
MKTLVSLYLVLASLSVSFAQNYTLQKCHAHNDYKQKHPFVEAYTLGFGSIEVDVFLINNELYVAHEASEIDSALTLKSLYIDPILVEIHKNNGKLKQPLQLLIDLKTGGETLKIVENQLLRFKDIFKKAKLTIVISGQATAPENFEKFDEMLSFDGRPELDYTKSQLKRLALFSHALDKLVKWNGKNQLDDDQLEMVQAFVKSIHKKGKKLRFWASPDTPTAWTTLMNLRLDYVGTDNLIGLAKFLE